MGGAFAAYSGVGPGPTEPGFSHHIFDSSQPLTSRIRAFMALSTTVVDNLGQNFTEVSTVATGYARQDVEGIWTISGGQAVNASAIRFGPATANWGTIRSAVIDNSTLGALTEKRSFYATLDTPLSIPTGRVFEFPPGSLTFRVTPPTQDASSEYVDEAVLNHALGIVNFPNVPATYVALSTADPGRDGSGLAEPSGNNYARVSVPRNQTSGWVFDPSGSGVFENVNEIVFPMATGSWGTISHFAILDAASGGNLIWQAPFTTPTAVVANRAPVIGAGALALEYN